MDFSVAGEAIGRVGITFGSRLPVNTQPELLDLVRVTLSAFRGRELCGSCHFVRRAMAGKTGHIDRSVNAR